MSDDDIQLTDEEKALLEAEAPAAEPEPEIEPEPEPEPEVKPKAKRSSKKDVADVTEVDTTEIGDPTIPAQMRYDEGPWGLMPVQMRHDADGNPVK